MSYEPPPAPAEAPEAPRFPGRMLSRDQQGSHEEPATSSWVTPGVRSQEVLPGPLGPLGGS